MVTRTRKATARLLIAWLALPETWQHWLFPATIRLTRRPTKSAANPGLSGHQQPLNFLARGRADDAAEAGALERGGSTGEPNRLRLWPALRQGQGKRGVKHIARCERIGGIDRKGRLMPHFRVVGCVRTPISAVIAIGHRNEAGAVLSRSCESSRKIIDSCARAQSFGREDRMRDERHQRVAYVHRLAARPCRLANRSDERRKVIVGKHHFDAVEHTSRIAGPRRSEPG